MIHNYDKDTIFVFGSNLAGVHGAGAARWAKDYAGAEWGVGEGPTGFCYALPTKDRDIVTRELDDIEDSIHTFLQYAGDNPRQTFVLTPVGCGLAGLQRSQVMGMIKRFGTIPSNVVFHSTWFDE